MAQDLQWEFALLDRQRKGAITKEDVQFLFQMVHGEFFSKFKFEKMMNGRKIVNSDVSFEEIEVDLCNIPTYDWIEELMKEQEEQEKGFSFFCSHFNFCFLFFLLKLKNQGNRSFFYVY